MDQDNIDETDRIRRKQNYELCTQWLECHSTSVNHTILHGIIYTTPAQGTSDEKCQRFNQSI